MSFLNWFGKKGPILETALSEPSDLGQVDATVPIHRPPSAMPVPERTAVSSPRRNERLERRELLYAVVRESMTAAGVLSSTYKFKVLSLDSSGRQYLIMMDMPRSHMTDPAHFAEIEGSIARSAKERYDILVTAVYWRTNDLVTAGAAPAQAAHAPAHTPRVEPVQELTPVTPVAVPSPYAPIQNEEVLAFKRAVASAASGASAAPRGELVHSGRRNPEPMPDFSDTEPFDPSSPLGTSQFGGL
jgi:hypothetical protein